MDKIKLKYIFIIDDNKIKVMKNKVEILRFSYLILDSIDKSKRCRLI